ncbi:MAG: hypothetical protein DRH08_10895 [Deltaproteobacteria bacterium]|nr:MAG: hypothetical protein DRH08_10895 [Deltaproteobacteria bacterium]
MTKNTDIFQIKSQFDDFDHFVQTIQGWKLTFQQLDRGKFTAELYQINTPEVLISDAHFNRHLIQDGTHPEGMCTFVIMAENSAPFIWRKQEVTEDNSLLVFPKGGELDSTRQAMQGSTSIPSRLQRESSQKDYNGKSTPI